MTENGVSMTHPQPRQVRGGGGLHGIAAPARRAGPALRRHAPPEGPARSPIPVVKVVKSQQSKWSNPSGHGQIRVLKSDRHVVEARQFWDARCQ